MKRLILAAALIVAGLLPAHAEVPRQFRGDWCGYHNEGDSLESRYARCGSRNDIPATDDEIRFTRDGYAALETLCHLFDAYLINPKLGMYRLVFDRCTHEEQPSSDEVIWWDAYIRRDGFLIIAETPNRYRCEVNRPKMPKECKR